MKLRRFRNRTSARFEYIYWGTTKLRNENETKRNETKYNETKRKMKKRNEVGRHIIDHLQEELYQVKIRKKR
jgi:hypothetical protein